jgi:hypothetical protein
MDGAMLTVFELVGKYGDGCNSERDTSGIAIIMRIVFLC